MLFCGNLAAMQISQAMRKKIYSDMGKRGAKARAIALSPERRVEIAKVAAAARWATTKKKKSK